MQMISLSITVWFTHFLIASALYFNTLPANTLNDYTEITPITTTNQQPEILTTATPTSPLNTRTTRDITTDSPAEVSTLINITPKVTFPQETTSLFKYSSSLFQNDMTGDGVSISTASDVTMSPTSTLNTHTTVSTNFATLMPHEENKNETGTTSSLSYNEDGQTVQTPDPFNSISTASWTEEQDETTKSDEEIYETNSTQATFANMNIATLTTHTYDKNETGTMLNVSYSEDGHTLGPFNSVSTASTKDDETTKTEEGHYETNSTQATFADVNKGRLAPHIDEKNETGTMSNVSYSADGSVQTPDPFNSISTASRRDHETTKTEEGNYETNSTQSTFAYINIERLEPQIDQKNETGTISNVSYSEYGHTVPTPDPFNSIWTASRRDDETTTIVEENYETNSTQSTFANTSEWTGTGATEGSYNFSSKHTVFNLSAVTATDQDDWSTSPTTDTPMITQYNTISQDPTATDEPQFHTSTDGGNQLTTQNNIYRFTSSAAQTENITGTVTPSGTTYSTNNNNSFTNRASTDITNATTDKMNQTDTESKEWPTCYNSESQSRRSVMVCFITVWTLAMTATIFLGISIFLWVRLSIIKKKIKQKEKRGHMGNKESLWADPKATVQERVEFWYVNGSTLEADRKEKNRKRQERMKRGGGAKDTEENELWIQPRVTVNDITEFWYANRRRNEMAQDMY